jgi:hypothetical protein
MRTTVTLTPEAEAAIKKEMRERNLSFKDALNEAIMRGVAERPPYEFRTRTHRMGKPRVNLDKANQIAAELENEEILRKMSMGK